MSDSEESGSLRGWLSTINLGIAVLSAGFALFVTYKQNHLEQRQKQFEMRVKTTARTEEFAEKVLTYLEKVSVPDTKQKEAIIIDLLDAVAQANASDTGEVGKEKHRQLPLRIALATGNVEALGLIGSDRRELVYELAKASGHDTVRRAAMETFARSSAADPIKHLLRVFELGEDLDNQVTVESALAEINRVVNVMARSADPAVYREAKELQPVVQRLVALRTTLATSVAAMAAEDSDEARDRRDALLRQAQGIERALSFLQAGEAIEAPPSTDVAQPATPAASYDAIIARLESPDSGVRSSSWGRGRGSCLLGWSRCGARSSRI